MMNLQDKLIKLELANNPKIYPSIEVNYESQEVKILNLSDDIVSYNPIDVPNAWEYLKQPEQVKIIIGPYGSGKTSAIVNRILYDAASMPKCNDGVRRYKIAFIRNTAGDLETTTLNTWLYWTRGLPRPTRNKKPVLQYFYEMWDCNGKIEMQVIFLGLDREADFNKLASLELTSAVFNEIQFIPKAIVTHMQTRIGRYPAKIEFLRAFEEAIRGARFTEEERKNLYYKWAPYKKRIYADTNPPENDHWIVTNYEIKKEQNIKIFHQPPALLQDKSGEWHVNRQADNILNQNENYYLDMLAHGEEFVKVYAQGKYGTVVDGKPVYPGYNDDFHSIERIDVNLKEPIGLFIDLGTVSPAVILMQEIKGQTRAIKEWIGEFITIKELVEISVLTWLKKNAGGCRIEVIQYDPSDTYDGSKQLEELKLEAEKAATNDLKPRINSVKNILNQVVGGKPRYILSREGCPKLRQGFLGKYHMRRMRIVGEERYEDKPNKNHPYSDIHDANQYGVMYYSEPELLESEEEAFNRHKNKINQEDRSIITGY